MKLAFFDDFKLGVVKGDSIVDVSAVVRDIPHTGPGDLISGLIAHFDTYRGKLEAASAGAGVAAVERADSSAAAEARQHRLHGGELHGERDAGEGRRRSTHSTRHRRRSSVRTIPWCCRMFPPRFSRARRRWRW